MVQDAPLICVDELRKVKDGRHFSIIFTIVSSFTRRFCYSNTSLVLFLTEIHDTSKITAFQGKRKVDGYVSEYIPEGE